MVPISWLFALLGAVPIAGLAAAFDLVFREGVCYAERLLRKQIEQAVERKTWTADLPTGASVETILIDGYHLLTGPLPLQMQVFVRCDFGRGIVVQQHARISVMLRLPGGALRAIGLQQENP